MTPQEKDLITTLLERLKTAGGQPKDAEADTLIRQAMAEQPDAPYYLAQTVLIQDLSLHNAQNRIAELEQRVSDAQAKPTSFLGGLFGKSQPAPAAGSVPPAGPWTRSPQVAAAPPPQPMAQPQQPYPPGGYPQGGYPPGGVMGAMGSGGGGFLRSAAATAAGVAGGALLFQGIESLFGRGSGGMMGGQGMTPGLGESVVNNYYGSDAGGSGSWDPGSGGSDTTSGQDYNSDQDAGSGQDYSSDQDLSGGDDSGGGDFGGGGDSTC
jgi:uncharacterized protein